MISKVSMTRLGHHKGPLSGLSLVRVRRAARVITCQGYGIRSQLKWKTLSQIRNSHKLIMMYKILNNMAPVYLRDHFKMSFTDQAYSLRNRKL